MRKLLVLLLFLPLMATAKIPVEEDIIRQTLDSESPYYYPNLMLRYQSGDDTMTEEDYHYLYYGYAYQDAYKPLNPNSDMDKAMLIAQTVDFENPTHESLEKLISAVNDALVQDPFSPKLLNLLAFAYGALGDSKNEQINYNRMNSILATIEDSGSRSAGRTRPSLRQSTRRQPLGGICPPARAGTDRRGTDQGILLRLQPYLPEQTRRLRIQTSPDLAIQ